MATDLCPCVLCNDADGRDGDVQATDFTETEKVSTEAEKETPDGDGQVESQTVAVNSTNFPDQRFCNWISANVDKDKNGTLEQKEILGVTQMNISGNKIANIQGVQIFTKLKTLDCSDNLLLTLDVSKLANLQKLDCSGNALTKLNVTGLTKLTELACTGGKLGALDLRSNERLESVQVCGCGLTSLRVKGLTRLKKLDYRFNSISNVDTTGCSALKTTRYAPQSSYTAEVGASWEVGFSKLREFQRQMASGDVVKNLENLEYGKNNDSFIFNYAGKKAAKGSFSIYNEKTGRTLGTCTIYAEPSESAAKAPEQPKLVKAVSGIGIRIFWKQTDNVTGYKILRKEMKAKDAKWEVVAAVNSTYSNYKDTTALLGTDYLYTVRAYAFDGKKNHYSRFDDKGLLGKASLKVPQISRAQNGAAPKFTWEAVNGADGYRIYRKKKGDTKWTQAAVVDKKQLSFSDTKAEAGTWYQYAVRPYRKIGNINSLNETYTVTRLLKCTAASK